MYVVSYQVWAALLCCRVVRVLNIVSTAGANVSHLPRCGQPLTSSCAIPTIRTINAHESETPRLTGARRSTLKCLPQLRIRIEIVIERDAVQRGSFSLFRMCNATAKWSLLFVWYREWTITHVYCGFRHMRRNASFNFFCFKWWNISSEVFYLLHHLKNLANFFFTKGQGSGTWTFNTLWGWSALNTEYFAASRSLLNCPSFWLSIFRQGYCACVIDKKKVNFPFLLPLLLLNVSLPVIIPLPLPLTYLFQN